MAKKQKAPVVVAELGRPETASETAARKAVDSHNYRARKTVNNLVLSLIVSLALVVIIVLAVPRGTGGYAELRVDVPQLAQEAAPSAGRELAAPAVPEAWKAKWAGLKKTDGVTLWQINYTTVDEATQSEAYASVVQAFTADGKPVPDDWIMSQLENQKPTGAESIGGIDWTVYEHTDRNPDESNMLFGLQGAWNGDTILVYGTDSPEVIRVLAADVATSLKASKE